MSEENKNPTSTLTISVENGHLVISGPRGVVSLPIMEVVDLASVAHGMREIVSRHAVANYLDGMRDGKGEERARIKGILEREIVQEADAVRSCEGKIAEAEAQAEHLRKLAEGHRLKIEALVDRIARIEGEGVK